MSRSLLPALGVRASQKHAAAEFRRPFFAPEAPEITPGPLYEREQFEEQPESRIQVPSTLVNPHPLIASTLASYKKAKVREDDKFLSLAGDTLSLDVSQGAVDRALRLFDALIRALEARGFPTTFERIGYKRYTVVHLGIENVTLAIRESKKWRAHVPDPKRPGQRNPEREPKYNWTLTGLLSIQFCPLEQPYDRHTLHESSRGRWEEYLNAVIVSIVRVQQEMALRQRSEEDRRVAEAVQ